MTAPLLETLTAAWLAWLPAALLEATLVAVLVLIGVRLGKRLSSPLRYGLVCVALLKFLVPPVLSLPIGLASWLPTHSFVAGAEANAETLEPVATAELLPWGPGSTPSRTEEPAFGIDRGCARDASPMRSAAPAVRAASHGAWLGAGFSLASLFFLLHACGSLLAAARFARQHRRLRAILRRCTAADDDVLTAAYRSACRRTRIRRAPVLLLSPEGFGPAAVGTLRRRVVVPAAAAHRLAGRLQPVLAHELAHHRRRDLWVEALMMGLGVIWWFNPAFWLVVRQLRRLREDCCDEAVLAFGRTSMASYCQCLLDVAAAVRGAQPAGATLMNGSRSHPMTRRIERMMSSSFVPSPRLSLRGAVTLAAAALFLLPGAGRAAVSNPVPGPHATPGASVPASRGPTTREAATSGPTSPETTLPAAAARETQSWWQEDRVRDLDRRAIDRLARLGLDRDFVEARRDEGDRTVSIEELRTWVAFGVDATLVDELAAQNIDELEVSELFRLITLRVDGDYIADLRRLGYDDLTFEEMVRLKRYDVAAEFVGDLRETGYADLSVDDLVTLTRYEVAADYIRNLSELGYDDLEVEELVRLRRYDIDIDFIEALGEVGQAGLSIDDLVTLHRYEVDPTFVVQVNELGYDDLSVEDLVRLKRYGVALDTMRRLHELGFTDLSVDGMVTLTRYGVDLDYITAMRRIGVETPEVQDLVTLQRYDVGPDYVAALAAAGYDALDVDDLVRLRRYDVDANYLTELAEAGVRDLSVDDIVNLRRYEIEVAYLEGLDRVGYGDISVADILRLHRYGVEVEFIERLQNAGFEDLTVDKIINLKRHS